MPRVSQRPRQSLSQPPQRQPVWHLWPAASLLMQLLQSQLPFYRQMLPRHSTMPARLSNKLSATPLNRSCWLSVHHQVLLMPRRQSLAHSLRLPGISRVSSPMHRRCWLHTQAEPPIRPHRWLATRLSQQIYLRLLHRPTASQAHPLHL